MVSTFTFCIMFRAHLIIYDENFFVLQISGRLVRVLCHIEVFYVITANEQITFRNVIWFTDSELSKEIQRLNYFRFLSGTKESWGRAELSAAFCFPCEKIEINEIIFWRVLKTQNAKVKKWNERFMNFLTSCNKLVNAKSWRLVNTKTVKFRWIESS